MFKLFSSSSKKGTEKIYTRAGDVYIPAKIMNTESYRQSVRRMYLDGYVRRIRKDGTVHFDRIAISDNIDEALIVSSLAAHLKLSESSVSRYLTV